MRKVTFESLIGGRASFPLDFSNLTDECIHWPRYRNKLGYGQFRYSHEKVSYNCLAHRASYIYYNNEMLTENDVVLHKCDNPSCFNPLHLKKGTQPENVADMCNKQRHRNQHTKKADDINGNERMSTNYDW